MNTDRLEARAGGPDARRCSDPGAICRLFPSCDLPITLLQVTLLQGPGRLAAFVTHEQGGEWLLRIDCLAAAWFPETFPVDLATTSP